MDKGDLIRWAIRAQINSFVCASYYLIIIMVIVWAIEPIELPHIILS